MAKYFLACIVLGLSPLVAQEFIPENSEKDWRVAIVDPPHLEAGQILSGMGAELLSFLSFLDEKLLTEEEIRIVREGARDEALSEARKRIQSIRREIDLLLFEEQGKLQIRRRRDILERDLRKAEQAFEKAEAYPEEAIEIETRRTLHFDLVSDVPSTLRDMQRFAGDRNFDQIVTIHIDRVDTLNYLVVKLYDRLTNTHEMIVEEFITVPERSTYSQRLATRIAPFLAGYPVSSLQVFVLKNGEEPASDASVYINDSFIGYGVATQLFRKSGAVDIVVRTPDGESTEHNLTLRRGEMRELYVYKDYQASDFIDVLSLPTGASVYRESVKIGETPLQVERPFMQQYLELQMPGFYANQLLLAPDSSELMMITLIEEVENLTQLLEDKRKKFYTSLAFFAFSVPLPIAFSALYQGREPYLNSAQLSEAARADNRVAYTAYYASFWTSLGITLSLTGYMFYRLIDYIRAAR